MNSLEMNGPHVCHFRGGSIIASAMEPIEKLKPHTAYAKEHGHNRGPYWKRAHHDWKFWIVIVIMLTAMATYLKTNDLSVRPRNPVPQQPTP